MTNCKILHKIPNVVCCALLLLMSLLAWLMLLMLWLLSLLLLLCVAVATVAVVEFAGSGKPLLTEYRLSLK
jgi:hypothetical protein